MPRFPLPVLLFCAAASVWGALPPDLAARAQPITLQSYVVNPTRIVWRSPKNLERPESLLLAKPGQVTRPDPIPACILTASADGIGGLLLDFGTELNGTLELATILLPGNPTYQPKVRVRFGESASEAMSELDDRQSSNDYAIRDQIVTLPWAGTKLIGPSGFRFVRIDAVDPQKPVPLRHARAILTLQNAPQLGAFRCPDERLNRIWEAGVYTVQLNLQDYVWDGIKRDRLVWTGDVHPELAVILSAFGANPAVPRSLDLIRDVTPPAKWMHGISSYSLWWVLMQEQWWRQTGDRAYLDAQKPYLQALLAKLATLVDEHGQEHLDGMRYLDWPTWENKPAIAAGLQALLVLTFDAGQKLSTELGDTATAQLCAAANTRLRTQAADPNKSKAAIALQILARLRDAKAGADLLSQNGPTGMSPFYGFYVLQALGQADATDTALDFIRTYWGAMLDRGATTFWEDFDLSWLENSGRIDELTPPGKKDLHGDFGIYGSAGFRKSLCHGWSAGPTAFLTDHVLGIRPLKAGCTEVLVSPHLGTLSWAEGSYPTPHGVIKVRHERQPDGTIHSAIDAPPGIKIVRDERPAP